MEKKQKVTIYTAGQFLLAPVSTEAYLISHKDGVQYAQYNNAVEVVFRPKGKRKDRIYIKGYNPFVLIVQEWGHKNPPSPFTEPKKDGEMITKSSKYSSHDEKYLFDFNQWADKQNFKIIADYRHTKQTKKEEVILC